MQITQEIKNVTVRQLLQLDIFKKYTTLVAGEKGLDRFVTHTTVWEAPDLADRLEGREFVFSMGYVTHTQPELAVQGFDALTDIVSAMGFKLGYYLEKIPDEYVRIANAKNIPLFAIKPNCLFKWLIQAIMAEINLYQASILMEVDRYFQDLYEIALSDSRDTTLLTQLSDRIHSPCLLLSADLESTTWGQHVLASPDEKRLIEELKDNLRASGITDREFRTGSWHVIPLAAKELCLGYLVLWDPDELSDKKKLMVKQLRMHLTMKWLERFEGTQRSLSSLWKSLLTDPEGQKNQINEMLNAHGIVPDGGIFVLILCAGVSAKETFRKRRHFLLGNIARLLTKSLPLWSSPDECVILCVPSGESDPPYWLAKAREILAAEKSAMLAIGPPVRDIASIRDSYRIAQNCVRIAIREELPQLLYFKEYLYELSLVGGLGTLESSLFLKNTLQPLLQYDAEHDNQNFISTIKALTRTENFQEAAASLHVHANTLRYRIQRINDLTGLNLYQYRDRAILAHGLFCLEFT